MKDVHFKFGGYNVESKKNYDALKESNLKNIQALKKLDVNGDRKLSDKEMKKFKDVQAEFNPENELVEIDDQDGFDLDNKVVSSKSGEPNGEFQAGQKPDKKPDAKPGGDKIPPEFLDQAQGGQGQMMDGPQGGHGMHGPQGGQGQMMDGPQGMQSGPMGGPQGNFGRGEEPQGMQSDNEAPIGKRPDKKPDAKPGGDKIPPEFLDKSQEDED